MPQEYQYPLSEHYRNADGSIRHQYTPASSPRFYPLPPRTVSCQFCDHKAKGYAALDAHVHTEHKNLVLEICKDFG